MGCREKTRVRHIQLSRLTLAYIQGLPEPYTLDRASNSRHVPTRSAICGYYTSGDVLKPYRRFTGLFVSIAAWGLRPDLACSHWKSRCEQMHRCPLTADLALWYQAGSKFCLALPLKSLLVKLVKIHFELHVFRDARPVPRIIMPCIFTIASTLIRACFSRSRHSIRLRVFIGLSS